jgi:hypothetical protein
LAGITKDLLIFYKEEEEEDLFLIANDSCLHNCLIQFDPKFIYSALSKYRKYKLKS